MITKEKTIEQAKSFRSRMDAILQEMKEHGNALKLLMGAPPPVVLENGAEVIAQHTLSVRALEHAIMRQGMALKYVGTPDPYPVSKLTVEEIARNLWGAFKMAAAPEAASELVTAEGLQKGWDEFCADPENSRAVHGWIYAAKTHPDLLRVDPPADNLKM